MFDVRSWEHWGYSSRHITNTANNSTHILMLLVQVLPSIGFTQPRTKISFKKSCSKDNVIKILFLVKIFNYMKLAGTYARCSVRAVVTLHCRRILWHDRLHGRLCLLLDVPGHRFTLQVQHDALAPWHGTWLWARVKCNTQQHIIL